MQHLLADGAVALRAANARKPPAASEADEGTGIEAAGTNDNEDEEEAAENGSDDDEEDSPVHTHIENALTAWQRWCPVALCEQLELRCAHVVCVSVRDESSQSLLFSLLICCSRVLNTI